MSNLSSVFKTFGVPESYETWIWNEYIEACDRYDNHFIGALYHHEFSI